jgi:hypothetical protein
MESLLDLQDLSRVLKRSPDTIKRDLRRNPAAVPPRLNLPGTKLLRWRTVDVDAWLSTHVQTNHNEGDVA